MRQFITLKAQDIIPRDLILRTHESVDGVRSRVLLRVVSVDLFDTHVKLEIEGDRFTAPVFLDLDTDVLILISTFDLEVINS